MFSLFLLSARNNLSLMLVKLYQFILISSSYSFVFDLTLNNDFFASVTFILSRTLTRSLQEGEDEEEGLPCFIRP